MAALDRYTWLFVLITIAFCASSFGNGSNDVANAYATSVAARTLTMPQVGILAMFTEFIGAVALGSRVTSTIKNGIIDLNRFVGNPPVLLLAMTCAEFGSAFWLITATSLGFPVSTTQTIVGALVGVGIASQAQVTWAWESGSVSQVAASWGIAPVLAACISAILFATLKFGILERANPFEKAMRAIPVYLAFTGAMLALFMVIEAPTSDGLDMGAGKVAGIVLGSFAGVLLISYVFFVPYFKRRLVRGDSRVRAWHIPLGPLLLRDNAPLYFPGKREGVTLDYYQSTDASSSNEVIREKDGHNTTVKDGDNSPAASTTPGQLEAGTTDADGNVLVQEGNLVRRVKPQASPEERWINPHKSKSVFNPSRIFGIVKWLLFQGVSRDCVTHASKELASVHAAAKVYDNRVEHLWTYAQVASAMMMSIAHGSNDVANAVGPWASAYGVWTTGEVGNADGVDKVDTPIWILAVAGFLLGLGFWVFGFKIIRSLGNKITQLSPTRGFAMELGAAITVLLASTQGLPVSTTQCLTGAVMGVALMNLDAKAVNFKQLGFIFFGWTLTLPSAGLIAGILLVMSLNTPHFS